MDAVSVGRVGGSGRDRGVVAGGDAVQDGNVTNCTVSPFSRLQVLRGGPASGPCVGTAEFPTGQQGSISTAASDEGLQLW